MSCLFVVVVVSQTASGRLNSRKQNRRKSENKVHHWLVFLFSLGVNELPACRRVCVTASNLEQPVCSSLV